MLGDVLSWDQTVFKNGEMFELDYVPEHFRHRDSQIEELMFSIRPAMKGMRPVNMLCLGPPGTGKTTAILKIFEEIEKHTASVIPVHINCQVDNTKYEIFSRIFQKIYGFAPPSSGVSFKKIFEKIVKYLIEKEKVLVVALDDINYLFYESEVNDVLYTLLRAHEVQPKARIGVIGVLSDIKMQYQLDPRVASVFLPREILFLPYTQDEIHDILSNRIQYGFFPGVVPEDILDKIVEYVKSSGDLRVGIDLLKKAGLNAERRASKCISLEDVNEAYESSRSVHIQRTISSLGDEEKVLLRLIAEGEEVRAGALYKKFQEKTNLRYTRFHEMLNKLDATKLINTRYSGKGTRGRSRLISVKNADDILKGLRD